MLSDKSGTNYNNPPGIVPSFDPKECGSRQMKRDLDFLLDK
jgi:hypothetical protein